MATCCRRLQHQQPQQHHVLNGTRRLSRPSGIHVFFCIHLTRALPRGYLLRGIQLFSSYLTYIVVLLRYNVTVRVGK